jgi:hypothetical protein
VFLFPLLYLYESHALSLHCTAIIDGTKTTMILRFDPHAKVMTSQTLDHFRAGNGVGVEWMDVIISTRNTNVAIH